MRHVFFKRNQICWSIYLLLLVADGGINLLISFILQQLTDAAVDKNMEKLIYLCAFCVISVLGILLCSVALYYTESLFLKRAMSEYKNSVLKQLLKKSCSSFGKENTSVYISALTNDAAVIESDYLKGTAKLIAHMFSFVATIAVMLAYNPYLTAAAMIFAVFPILLSILAGDKLAIKEKEVSTRNGIFVGTIKDMLTGFAVIKSFRAEREMENIYRKENDNLENAKYYRNLVRGKVALFAQLGILISQFGLFLSGAFLAVVGKGVTAGILIAFVNLMGSMMVPVSAVPQLYGQRKAACGLIKKMETALIQNVVEQTGEKAVALKHGITFNSVSCGYTDENDTLKNISLQFESGKSYAIVGTSGSGKSTLLDVMLGNFKKYRGTIEYDGKELRQINMDSLYDLISVVQQNVFIFDSSIRDNITMFREFPRELIKQAITHSGLDRVIEEKGEDYLCGENGCNISGGERQRISIARSLLRKKSIFVADEATASLDVKTAYDIMDTILNMEGTTRVVVTHQLDSGILGRYDGIVVLKNGMIEEMGTFAELMERREYFYSLYMLSQTE